MVLGSPAFTEPLIARCPQRVWWRLAGDRGLFTALSEVSVVLFIHHSVNQLKDKTNRHSVYHVKKVKSLLIC